MPYYGLYIPAKGGGATTTTAACSTVIANGSAAANAANTSAADNFDSTEPPYVFRVKCEALEVLKMHKDARLREFTNEDDAIKYAQTGYEVVQTKYNDVKTSTAALEKAAFRAPTKQELIEFRKIIEAGDCERVKSIIWDNPRYLVSSGDTPTTLKEGYRYNAMHVCSISKRPQIAELILKTVADPKFVDLLTGKKNDKKMCEELCLNLLDYYLNIPEKGRSETPLHLSAKYGCVEMVEILTSYPECKMTPNNDGLLPKDIICSRVPHAAPEIYKKIEALLEERFYVPVLRSMDSAIPAQIGQPFSASNPPKLNCDPLSPEVEIKALAGPMNKDQAKQFFRRWKTPPRLGSSVSSPIANNPYISPMKSRTPTKTPQGLSEPDFRSPAESLQRRCLFGSTPQRPERSDLDVNDVGPDVKSTLDDSLEDKQNGNHKIETAKEVIEVKNKSETNNNHTFDQSISHLVNIQKDPTDKMNAALCPRTPLFKIKKEAFSTYREQNVASPITTGIDVVHENECFLNSSDVYDSPGYKERHIKNTDVEKGLECIGRELAKEQNVEWREYWDFLKEFVDIASGLGLQKLENYLAQRQREEEMSKKIANSSVILSDVCTALEKFGFSSTNGTIVGLSGERQRFCGLDNDLKMAVGDVSSNVNVSTAYQSTTPYTYVEKSLQVHARRMTKTIVHNIENVVSINDALLLELRRVKSLICSFKEDIGFVNVNFKKVHSRIGNLVSIFLENSQEVTPNMIGKVLKILENLLLTPGDRREHIECVCARIRYMLEHPVEQILPENLKTEEMCSKVWLQESDCECQWESNLSRKTSRRSRMEARYKTHQRIKQQEKAQKQQTTITCQSSDDWRNVALGNDSSDDMEDDVYWSDFGGSDSDDEDEVWYTPPGSPSRTSRIENTGDDGYKIYIYGNEPTKRDLDVLNAIFHIDVDKQKHPNIYSWKVALLRYPNEEMDYFPSPRIIKKSHSFVVQSARKNEMPSTPFHQKPNQSFKASFLRQQSSGETASPTVLKGSTQSPTVKSLCVTPGRSKSMTSVAEKSTAATAQHQAYVTPLNKIRGLFSAYRERLDSSPLSASSASPAAFLSDRNNTEGSNNNLSLLDISASE